MTVTSGSDSYNQVKAYADVKAVASPVTVTLDGGLTKDHFSGVDLLLNAVLKDPNTMSDSWLASWTCGVEPSLSACTSSSGGALSLEVTTTSSSTADGQSRALIPAGTLTAGQTYRFTVLGNRTLRTDTDFVSVSVKAYQVPEVSIAQAKPTTAKANPSDKVQLVATAAGAYGGTLSYAWECTTSSLTLQAGTNTASSLTGSSLVVKPDILFSGVTYNFQLTVTETMSDGSSVTAVANADVEVNTPPQTGTVSVSPGSGTAGTTLFTISTTGWTDEDGISSYEYARLDADGAAIPMAETGKTSTQVYLLEGEITIQVKCVDSYGGFSTATTVISVSAMDTSDVASMLADTSSLQALLDEGNPAQVLQQLSAVGNAVSGTEVSAAAQDSMMAVMESALASMDTESDAGKSAAAGALTSMPATTDSAKAKRLDMVASMIDKDAEMNEDVAGALAGALALAFSFSSRRSEGNFRRSDTEACCTNDACLSKKYLLGNTSTSIQDVGQGLGNSKIVGETSTNLTIKSSDIVVFSLTVKKEDSTSIIAGATISSEEVAGDSTRMSATFPTCEDVASGVNEKSIVSIVYGATNNPFSWAQENNCFPSVESTVGNSGSLTVLDQTVANLKCPISITLSVSSLNESQTASCRFFSDEESSWSQEGCFVSSRTTSHITCSCYHLTSFSAYSAEAVVSSASVADPIQDETTVLESEPTYLIPVIVFGAIILALAIILAVLIFKHRRYTNLKNETESKYKTEAGADAESNKNKFAFGIHGSMLGEEAKLKAKREAEASLTMGQYVGTRHSMVGIYQVKVGADYGPIRRCIVLLAQVAVGCMSAALWYERSELSTVSTLLATTCAVVVATLVYSLSQYLFTREASITGYSHELQPHVKRDFTSRLRLTVFCLYGMMVQLILFSLYTTTIIAIHFEKDQTTGWLMAVGGFIVLSAFVVEPLLLLVLYYYEIKYHPASELNIEPRVKEKSDVVQEDVNEEPHKIPDVAQEPFFEDVSGGQDAEDDISSVPQRHAFGADMVHPLIDPSTVQVHRNEAVDPNADVQYAPEDLPPQEPLPISPNQEAPGVQRPDTPIRAQTPFRAQTPAVGLTGLSPIGIPAVPNFGIIPEETHDQLRTSYAEPEVAESSPMNVVYPQSPPQTPPAAAVAMAEIQRMRQVRCSCM